MAKIHDRCCSFYAVDSILATMPTRFSLSMKWPNLLKISLYCLLTKRWRKLKEVKRSHLTLMRYDFSHLEKIRAAFRQLSANIQLKAKETYRLARVFHKGAELRNSVAHRAGGMARCATGHARGFFKF
jgi:hypothetical protein